MSPEFTLAKRQHNDGRRNDGNDEDEEAGRSQKDLTWPGRPGELTRKGYIVGDTVDQLCRANGARKAGHRSFDPTCTRCV